MSDATSTTTDNAVAIDIERFALTLAREAPDAIIYADSQGIIRFWNHGAERVFGFADDEALGRSLDIIIPERLRVRHWAGYTATMRSGVTRYGAGEILAVPATHKDGRRISVEFTVLPFRDEAGRIIGIAAILRDVTARFEEMRMLRAQVSQSGESGNFRGCMNDAIFRCCTDCGNTDRVRRRGSICGTFRDCVRPILPAGWRVSSGLPAAVSGGHARAASRRGEGRGGRSHHWSDFGQCRARRRNWRWRWRGRQRRAPGFGAQFRRLLLSMPKPKGGIMKTRLAVLMACLLAACAQIPTPPQEAAVPQPAASSAPAIPLPAPSEAQVAPGIWNVDRVRCADLLGASDDDRSAAVMFYYGYLAARAGIHIIDVSQIRQCAQDDGSMRRRAEHDGSAGLSPSSRPTPVSAAGARRSLLLQGIYRH